MAQMYYSKLTGALTDKQYDSDRYGNLLVNRVAPSAAVAAAQGVKPDYYSDLRGGSPQQQREAQYQLGMMTGRFGASSQNATPSTTYAPAGEGQGTSISDIRVTVRDPSGNIRSVTRVADMPGTPLAQIAKNEARYRPGYTPGAENIDPQALEYLRQQYEREGRTRQEGQAQNTIQQWAQNKVETASEYHYLGQRSGVAVPANPFEYQGDLAVEFLKGTPRRSSEMFSPVSGEMSGYLPGGTGLQEFYWNRALSRDRGQGEYITMVPIAGAGLVQERTQIDPWTSITRMVTPMAQASFIPAIQHIQAAEKSYGPYGSLFGGDRYVGSPSSDGLRRQPDFVFTPEARANVDAAIRTSEQERGDMSGLRTGLMASAPLVLTGRILQSGDIKAYPEAAGLGRLTGSKTVAGVATVSPIPGQVAEGAHASEMNANIKKCNNNFAAAASAATGGIIAPSSSSSSSSSVGYKPPTGSMMSPREAPTKAGETLFTPFWFNETGKAIAGLPILGDIYRAGASVKKNTPERANALQGFFTTAPILKNIAFGGEVFAAKKEYERSPSDETGMRYKGKAALLVGSETNQNMITYGVASPFIGAGKAYREGIVNPAEKVIGKGVVQSAALGFLGVPGAIVETLGMSIVGGERTAKNIQNFPALVAAGGAMTAESAIEDPVRFGAGLLGTYGLFRAGGIITQKGIGIARSAGKEYVPIENIGYDTNVGYPIKPVGGTSRQLINSFYENKLIPEPKQMSAGKTPTTPGIAPPYLHGKGGVPAAKLPTTQPGDPLLWTAHESNALAKGVKVGEAYKMTGTGTSELDSISAAPVAEGYFAKTGGMIPENIGFSSPFKSPTIYATVVQGLETIPGKVKAALPRNAQGKITDYSVVNQYMQKRLTAAPGGQAFVPMLKGEFEANIATNSIFEVTGRKYYTKLGGIGKSHFGGTRVPIVEQDLIGFSPAETPLPQIKSTRPGSSYRSAPEIGGYSAIGASAISMGYGGYSQRLSSPTSKMSSNSPDRGGVSYSTRPSSTPASAASSKTKPTSSTGGSKGSYLRGSSPVESYLPSQYKSSVSPSKTTSTTSPRSNIYSPPKTSPKSSKTTPPYTPPYSPPKTPPATPPSTPGTPGGFPIDLPGGYGSGGGILKPRRSYTETLGFEVSRVRRNTFAGFGSPGKKPSTATAEEKYFRAVGKGMIKSVTVRRKKK